jgi:hypothetical protein
MKNSFTHAHQKSVLSKYKTRISRLQKAIREGTFSRYLADKKRQLFQCLARYERRLQQWGIAVATGTLLLLPANHVSAQTPLPVGSEFQVNTYTTSRQRNPSVAMDSDGDFVICWSDYDQDGSYSGIYAQRYDNTGTAQGSEFRVNTYTTGPQGDPSVAMDSDGNFVISWNSSGYQFTSARGIYAQRYNNSGVAQGSEFRVNTFSTINQRFTSVAMDSDGDFVICWYSRSLFGSNYDIYAQRYNNSGVAQGSEFRVNTYTTISQSRPSVAMDSDGDFVISWTSNVQDGSNTGVYAQRYNNTGVAQGSEFRVNTYTTSLQRNASVAMDSDGNFVISWTSYLQDGSSGGIFAQRYSNTGTVQGPEFRVNTYTNSEQFGPSVAMDSDGDFVISWTSNLQDGSNFGIYAQRYDNTGVAQGSEFQVNTYTTLFQTACSVRMDNAGDFVISWHSYLQDGSDYGVYAQRYMFPAPLPIELLFFSGHEETTANILEWATATEKNSAWQIIERSANGVEEWTEIGRVAGAGTSTTPVSYKISDENPLPLGYYRIKAIDFDGSEQFSEVISISRTSTELSILNVFPVPVEKEASILVNMPASGAVKVSLFNSLGQLVHQSSANLSKGVQEVKIEMGNMPAGLYAVTIEDGMTRVKQQVVKM